MYTPLFFNNAREIFRFIYFTGYEYKIVSAENYSGLEDYLRSSPAVSCEDLLGKLHELNAPIETSKEAFGHFCLKIRELGYHPDHVVATERLPNGAIIARWAEEPSRELQGLYPLIEIKK
jgi:hypothetical protein